MIWAVCYQHGTIVTMRQLDSAFYFVKLFDGAMDCFLFSQVLKLH